MKHRPQSSWIARTLFFFGVIVGPLSSYAITSHTTSHSIAGTWQPIVECAGCDPSGAWSGTGATNTRYQSLLSVSVQAGEELRVAGLGGSVVSDGKRLDCRLGDPTTARIPIQTPVVQFIDARNHVISLQDGGYNGTNSVRLIDLQRKSITVPQGATGLWGSWPDKSYGDNKDLCYFQLQRSSKDLENTIHFSSASSSSASSEARTTRRSVIAYKRMQRRPIPEPGSDTDVRLRKEEPDPLMLSQRNTRLICRVRKSLVQQNAFPLTLSRATERIAQRYSLPEQAVEDIFADASACAGLWLETAPIPPNERQDSDDGTATQDNTNTSDTTSRPTQKPPTTKPVEKPTDTSAGTDGTDTTDAATNTPPPGQQQRILCRIQERLRQSANNTDQRLSIVASITSEWGVTAENVNKALDNPLLCTIAAIDVRDGVVAQQSTGSIGKYALHEVLLLIGIVTLLLGSILLILSMLKHLTQPPAKTKK